MLFKLKRAALPFLAAAAALLLASCSAPAQSAADADMSGAESGALTVHYIDVGQGDSEFIEFPDGQTMLIDAGEREYGGEVCDYIASLGYSQITYVVATHPHSDHIGGLPQVFESFDVQNVFMPNASSSSKIFSELLDAVELEGCPVLQAKSGADVFESGTAHAYFLSPVYEEYDNLNDYSAVLRVTFGDTAFLFMGDAEEPVEEQLSGDISADVVKVGHHGSSTSSSADFVSRVSAQYAVMEVGADNSYGHPHEEIVERWQSSGAKVLRTDELGDIVISSNGSSLSVSSQKDAQVQRQSGETHSSADYEYVLNTSSKTIHMPDCGSVSSMSDKNKRYSSKPLSQLEAAGYKPCGRCMPE